MTDTANAPERIWTADTTGNCSVGFNTPSLDYKNEYISRAHHDEQVAAARAEGAREAQAKLDELRSDRPFIVGWNEGFAEAEYQQAHGKPSDGDLSPQYQHTAADLAEAQAKIARLTEALTNVMGYIDTPIGRRLLRINEDQPEWLTDARAALQEYADG